MTQGTSQGVWAGVLPVKLYRYANLVTAQDFPFVNWKKKFCVDLKDAISE